MKFGIFHLMPRRDPAKPDKAVFTDIVEQTHAVEQLDFDIAWFAEHHFSNYCLCPSPLVMAAYCAPLTRKIRLGTACLVTPLYNPVRMIEEIAMVDNLSDGRLVIGLGSGYQEYEFERFGVDLNQSKPMFSEILDIYEMAYCEGQYEYQGEFFHIPASPLSISPVQNNLPETWITGLSDSPALMERIAQSGYVPFATAGPRPASTLVSVKSRWADVYEKIGRPREELPFAIQRNLHVTQSVEDARHAADNVRYTARVAASMRNKYQQLDGAILREIPAEGEPSLEEIEKNALIGDPAKCTDQLIAEIEAIEPSHISLFVQFGSLPQTAVMKSIELFGERVLPAVEEHFGSLDQVGSTVLLQTPRVASAGT